MSKKVEVTAENNEENGGKEIVKEIRGNFPESKNNKFQIQKYYQVKMLITSETHKNAKCASPLSEIQNSKYKEQILTDSREKYTNDRSHIKKGAGFSAANLEIQ